MPHSLDLSRFEEVFEGLDILRDGLERKIMNEQEFTDLTETIRELQSIRAGLAMGPLIPWRIVGRVVTRVPQRLAVEFDYSYLKDVFPIR